MQALIYFVSEREKVQIYCVAAGFRVNLSIVFKEFIILVETKCKDFKGKFFLFFKRHNILAVLLFI